MKNNELIKKILKQIADLREQDFEDSFDPFYFMFNKGVEIKNKIADLYKQLKDLGYEY